MTAHSSFALFSHAPRGQLGYEPAVVDSFLARARRSFQGETQEVTSEVIRTVAFPLMKRGYEVRAVDAALARLEDAFAVREREFAVAMRGTDAWIDDARESAQEILVRLSRPAAHRFARAGVLRTGYSVREVDAVADRITAYLALGTPLAAEQLRTAAFRPQRGGYREEQVDALLDAAVRVILAVR